MVPPWRVPPLPAATSTGAASVIARILTPTRNGMGVGVEAGPGPALSAVVRVRLASALAERHRTLAVNPTDQVAAEASCQWYLHFQFGEWIFERQCISEALAGGLALGVPALRAKSGIPVWHSTVRGFSGSLPRAVCWA